jgi:hypothetical protein
MLHDQTIYRALIWSLNRICWSARIATFLTAQYFLAFSYFLLSISVVVLVSVVATSIDMIIKIINNFNCYWLIYTFFILLSTNTLDFGRGITSMLPGFNAQCSDCRLYLFLSICLSHFTIMRFTLLRTWGFEFTDAGLWFHAFAERLACS